MRRVQNDTSSTSQAIRNLATNPEMVVGVSDKVLRTNLATNPSFEISSGTVNVRTNLITNPSMEATSGTVIARTNLAQNPRVETTGNGWNQNDGTKYPSARSTTLPISGTASYMTTRSATGPNVEASSVWLNGSHSGGITGLKVTPNKVYTISLDIRAEQTNRQSRVYTVYKNAAGTSIYSAPSVYTDLVPNQVTRIWQTSTAPADADSVAVVVINMTKDASLAIEGERTWFDNLLIEQGSTLREFFDANAPLVNLCTNPSFDTNTTGYTTVSASLTRVTTKGDGAVGELTQVIENGTRQGAIALLPSYQPVGTYTISFDAATAETTLSTIRVLLYSPALGNTVHAAPVTPLTLVAKDGVTFTRYSFVVQTTDTFDRVYIDFLGTAIPLTSKSWVDKVMIERGTTPGVYYTGTGDFTYAWTGTAEQSTSTQTAPKLAGYTLELGALVYRDSTSQMSGVFSGKVLSGSGDMYQTVSTTVAGEAWTYSLDYKTAGTLTGNPRLHISGGGSSYTYSLPLTQLTPARFSVTLPATTAGLTYVVAAIFAATTGDFWVDNVLLEKSSLNLPFFDGATAATTDFTHVWQGAANASSSFQQAPAFANTTNPWGNNAVYQRPEGIVSGSKSVRIGWREPSTMLTLFPVAAASPSSPVTISMSVRPSTALTQVRLVSRSYTDAGGTAGSVGYAGEWFTCPAGQVTRISQTFTPDAGAVSVRPQLNVEQSVAAGSYMDVDGLLVEQASAAMPYFDGSSAVTPDFTHFWSGAANASTSTQRVMNISNVGTSIRATMYSSAVAPFSGSATAKGIVNEVGYFPRYEQAFTPIPGRRYTAMVKMKASTGPVQVAIKWSANPDTYNPVIVEAASNGNWATLKTSEVCPPNATVMNIWMGVPTNTPIGTEFEIDQLMVVSTDYNGPFGNGDSYGWEWEGVPHASTSKGYPVGLAQLAGKPLFFQTTSGYYALTDIDPEKNPVIPADAPRTIYTIVDVLGDIPIGTISTVLNYGADSLSDVTDPDKTLITRIQYGVGGASNNLQVRRTGGAGPSATGVPSSGRHVLISGMDAGRNLFAAIDKSALSSESYTMSIPHERILISTNSAYHNHIATYIYPGVHSSAVRQEMAKLLAHVHNIPGM